MADEVTDLTILAAVIPTDDVSDTPSDELPPEDSDPATVEPGPDPDDHSGDVIVIDKPKKPKPAKKPKPKPTVATPDGERILTLDERNAAKKLADDAEKVAAVEAQFVSRIEPGELERMDSAEFVAHAGPADPGIGARGQLVRTYGQGVAGNRADMWFENGVQINKPNLTLVNCRIRAEIGGTHPATFVRCTLSPGLIDLPGHAFIDCNTKEL